MTTVEQASAQSPGSFSEFAESRGLQPDGPQARTAYTEALAAFKTLTASQVAVSPASGLTDLERQQLLSTRQDEGGDA